MNTFTIWGCNYRQRVVWLYLRTALDRGLMFSKGEVAAQNSTVALMRTFNMIYNVSVVTICARTGRSTVQYYVTCYVALVRV